MGLVIASLLDVDSTATPSKDNALRYGGQAFYRDASPRSCYTGNLLKRIANW